MKRIIFFGLVLAVSTCLFGCGKAEILDGSFKRNEEYTSSFDTKYMTLGDLTVHMEKKSYNEEALKTLSKLIEADYKKIKKTGKGQQNEVSIYLVDKTFSGKPQVSRDKLFCRPDDIESGEYRLYLTEASFSLPCLWKAVGQNIHIFGGTASENVITNEKMKDYFDRV